MILYNQTQDCFSPDAHYEETPSQMMEKEYDKKFKKISDLCSTTELWEFERKYQHIFFEEEVNQLLFCAVEVVKIIGEIRKRQEFPMIRLEYFDPRDILQIYKECWQFYDEITNAVSEQHEFHLRQINSGKIYTIREIKSYFQELEEIIERSEKIKKMEKKIQHLGKKMGIITSLDEFNCPKITVKNIKCVKKQLATLSQKYCDKIEELKYEYRKQYFEKLQEEADTDIIIFSANECPYELFGIEQSEVPKMQKKNMGFAVNRNDKESIEKFLKRIVHSDKYYLYSV